MTITPDSVRDLLQSQDFGDRLRGINQLRQLDPAIAFELIQIPVVDSNVRVRYAAVSQVASLGSQDLSTALQLLQVALADSEPDVQAAAADSICALQLTEAYPDLETLYRHSPEWLVQFSIIAGLGELGDPRSFDLLVEALNSENVVIQPVAIGSLGELGDPRAVELLIPYATNPDWQVRQRVVQALARLNTPEARSTIETLTHDESESVASQAKQALTA
ncbi:MULTISPECIES: phycobilisome degradation protein NblB [Leptolyngbya]|uniref:HEAT repeat domain-containing protein n=1 Tax=Leptolyngbya boryana CZ1 TaxID=3060204 RepID=A0AA96X5N4_LEPBY|nr:MULTISPECIES: HEAT repeat domain-containing protein [Leptolyngbya]MBD1854259.1 HEAT repeat domain-containing protein [Leptolyngbya sp. FACHB-1624]MBN8561020.1 HEAT repeat domain-containing protein [Leptolyngbya sp. UWPOB_LEPTO1]MCY6491174.1 HEAT repeat domain-containing protein [Leptolyngbya sp. GGD]WNZ46055.1 HEAT repeat domain-containing protein [Leptolyngbya boryana CZ1]